MITNALCIKIKKKIAVKLFLVGYYGLASTALIVDCTVKIRSKCKKSDSRISFLC